jgi:hypothetical protein
LAGGEAYGAVHPTSVHGTDSHRRTNFGLGVGGTWAETLTRPTEERISAVRLHFVLSISLVVLIVCGSALAQNGTPSSKATAAINTSVGCVLAAGSIIGDTLPQKCHDIFSGAAVTVTGDNFATIMETTIKVSNSQSLFVSPSLVTGLYTQTKVKTSPSASAGATDMGGVFLRAIVKNQATGIETVGYPVAACTSDILGCQNSSGKFGVTLDTRVQTLTQEISDCIVNGGATTGACTFNLTTDLILRTTSAHTFNFIFPSVGAGTYTVLIQAAVNASGSGFGTDGAGSTAVEAVAYGLGSLTVESVRLVKHFSF